MDPEKMPGFHGYNCISQFHYDYLKKTLAEKSVSYTKPNPRGVKELSYLEALQKRIEDSPAHLKTLQHFLSFCDSIQLS
ncbi:MAG: hypothetical protein GY757_10310 [bacterium]|nr:hypothetical protein [bacterium]